MNILALDTSGPCAGVALMENGVITHEITACHGLTHSQTAMPMLDQTLSAAGLQPKDIDLFAAVAGPGSFTGVRIGVCAIKGLAHACGKKVIAIDALETLAAGAFGFPGLICPILDARRSQVYCAAFRYGAGMALPERVMPDEALPLTEFIARLPKDELCLFLGDGLKVHFPAIRTLMGERAVSAPASMAFIRPSSACMLAEQYASQATDAMLLKPIYLRAPQAERERNARLAQAEKE